VTEWEPATEAEAAMGDALRTSDQELYFRILSRTELLLPVSADALAGRTAMGWGTWASGGRTHVLSFTSPDAMRICLAENAGSARKIAFHELANTWPNHEWWLAVNPGLPIEGYLPPWFVGQLARGDVRLPGRSSATRRESDDAPVRDAAAPDARRSPPPPPTRLTPPAAPSTSMFDSPLDDAPLDDAPTSMFAASSGAQTSRFATAAGGATSRFGAAPAASTSQFGAAASASAPIEPDDVIDVEETQVVNGAPANQAGPQTSSTIGARRSGYPSRTASARDPVRRVRRYEASIIDAEIISSTVLGASAMEARIVDATVVDPGRSTDGRTNSVVLDVDVIDATVVETDVDERTQVVGRPSGPAAPMAAAATGARRRAAAAKDAAASGVPDPGVAGLSAKPSFTPANEVETNLLAAASSAKTDNFLSTLLLAKVLIPIPTGESADVRPDDPAFPWRREVVDGQAYLVIFTSPERMTEFMGDGVVAVTAKFVQLIRFWPDANWAFAVNPGTPVGATLPGAQIKALAVWAADVGLTADDDLVEVEEPEPPAPPPSTSTIIMQKPIAPSQVDYYLERGYDRASGFVHRATEVVGLHTPEQIYSTLGLSYTGTPFQRDATDVYVLRWAAHRGDLYRIPYGGQHEAGMRAMQGWMIERAPFRGNGFTPAERGEVIAEFKVDSIRLPHGAQMWRLTSTGDRMLVAVLDADECVWRAAIDVGITADWDPAVPASVRPTLPPTATLSARAHVTVPGSRPAQAAAPVVDPTDDPLDPRWRGKPTGRGSASWSASRVGER
jgi:hypothetical protein